MSTYIALLKYTQQGLQNWSEASSRIAASRQMTKDAGGELKAYYLTMGQYDAIAVVEMPSDEAYAKLLLKVAASGNVTSETLKAFTEDEARKIFSEL